MSRGPGKLRHRADILGVRSTVLRSNRCGLVSVPRWLRPRSPARLRRQWAANAPRHADSTSRRSQGTVRMLRNVERGGPLSACGPRILGSPVSDARARLLGRTSTLTTVAIVAHGLAPRSPCGRQRHTAGGRGDPLERHVRGLAAAAAATGAAALRRDRRRVTGHGPVAIAWHAGRGLSISSPGRS